MLKDIIDFCKFLGNAFAKSLYYGLIIAYLIFQVGCASVRSIDSSVSVANKSIPYGKSKNKLASHYTGQLFH